MGAEVGPAMLETPRAVAPPADTGDAIRLYYSQTRSRQEAGLFDEEQILCSQTDEGCLKRIAEGMIFHNVSMGASNA